MAPKIQNQLFLEGCKNVMSAQTHTRTSTEKRFKKIVRKSQSSAPFWSVGRVGSRSPIIAFNHHRVRDCS